MMSVLAKFQTGFALKENGRTVYIIPNSSEESEFLPLDLIVLETSETVGQKPSRRKLYEAFKVHVTKNCLENGFKSVDTDCSGRILKDAMGGSKLTTLELLHEDDGTCLKVSYEERNNGSKIEGSLRLEKIELVPSVGSMLETVVMNLMRTAQENSALRAGARELNLKQEKLEALFQELVHGKSKLEDRLVRAFTKVLNAKKRKIRDLKKEITVLKKRREDLSSDHRPSTSKRKRKAKSSEIISSSESETEVFSDRDEDVTDYDAETDVHESDEGGHETRISNVNNVTNSSDRIAPETPSTSTCKKNLFSGPSKKTEKISGRKFTGKCPANLFDSQSDSSQEINKPPEAGPSEVSHDETLRPNSKENVTCDDDEDTETQFIPVGDLENANDKTDLGATQAKLPVCREMAGGNDDMLKKLFGFDSQ